MPRRNCRDAATLLFIGLMVLVAGPVCTAAAESQDARAERVGILDRLAAVNAEAERTAPGQPLQDESLGVVAVIETSHIGSTNYYTADGVKYIATRVALVNLTDENVTILRSSFKLIADKQTFTLEQAAGLVKQMPLQVGNRTEAAGRLQPQGDVEIPAEGQATIWLMFAGLEKGPFVPAMTLQFDVNGKTQKVDLTRFHRGLLKMNVQRIGPRGALGLITIGGLLDSVSAGHLTDALDELAADGVARCVIRWTDDAGPLTLPIMNWMLTARVNQQRQNRRYSELPRITESIRELRLANVPQKGAVVHVPDSSGIRVFGDETDAVAEALRSAYEVLPAEDIVREIEQGHRLSRIAALRFGGLQLRDRDVEVVLACTYDDDARIVEAAIDALQHFGSEAAVGRLVEIVRQGSPTTSERALGSLVMSRYPAAHQAVVELLKRGVPMPRKTLMRVLARQPRRQWTEQFVSAACDIDPDVRLAALAALARIGHSRRPELLADALASEHEPLRQEAFRQLVQLADPRSEALALEFALQRLKTEPPDGTVGILLTRTRDARAVPLLIEHLKNGSLSERKSVVRLLAKIGGPEIDTVLVEFYPGFEEQTQAEILKDLGQLQSPLVRDLAAEALLSQNTMLVNAATDVMLKDGSDRAVQILEAALAKTDRSSNWSAVCHALSNIGTPAARAALRKARDMADDRRQRIVVQALRNLSARSTGGQFMRRAQISMRQEKWEEADEQFSAALELDPDLVEARQGRGNVRLKLKRFKEAAEDFEHVLKVDPEDGEAITGLGVALAVQGEHERAVQLVQEKADKFEKDMIFAYNTACVYGRALESLSGAEESEKRDETITTYREAALTALARSIELGFADTKLISSDPDLNSLRETDGFRTLVQKLQLPAAEEPAPEPDDESDAR